MPRVFACLAICNFLLLAATAGAGIFRVGATPDRHVLLAVVSLIVTCFLQVLTFTYFTVTGKMIAQMVHLGRLDTAYLAGVRRYKRRVTRLLAVCMVGAVLSAATGGALWRSGAQPHWHWGAGALLLVGFLFAVYHQFNAIVLNGRLMDEVTQDYEVERASRSFSKDATRRTQADPLH